MSAMPRSSPWGAVQHCEELIAGVYEVNTAGHGGIMVRKNAAAFLSEDAIKTGAFVERSYFCFEEDCCAQIVIRELLDKKLWQIPDRITDKAWYENAVNQSIEHNHPEYWAARQKLIAPLPARKEQAAMIDARKDIVFRNEDYKEKFRIKDGEKIKITYGYDGEEVVRKCRFLDEMHLNVGTSCYHIDEFMEKMKRAGNIYEPMPGQKPKLDVVIAEPGQPPRDAELALSDTALRKVLGGKPEVITQDKFSVVVQGAGGNGTIVAMGLNGGNMTSIHPYDAQNRKRELAERVPAAEERKPTLAERLEAGKVRAASQDAGRQPLDAPRTTKAATEH